MNYFLLFTVILVAQIVKGEQDILSQLKKYELVEPFHTRIKRSSPSGAQDVKFNAFGKLFHLRLSIAESVLAPDFKVEEVDGDGHRTPVHISPSEFYRGFIAGDPDSVVHAFSESEDSMSAVISTKDDNYMLEPLARYNPEVTNDTMIFYKQSDILNDPAKNESFCRGLWPPVQNATNSGVSGKSDHNRVKRAVDTRQTDCGVYLVADFKFYQFVGKSDARRTSQYLIELMDRINNIYRNTDFIDETGKTWKGYGFTVKGVLVHNAWTNTQGHYNMKTGYEPDVWDINKKLKAFGWENYGGYCLAHLFTTEIFTEGVLGLAWIASHQKFHIGGICSASTYMDGYTTYLNTAWTTYKDSSGNRLLSLSAHLVTAHEFGHNWGSDHDPDTQDCSPDSKHDGSYVMYTYSVSGYERNNMIFSPCSRRAIGRVLSGRSHECFTVAQSSGGYCGNWRIDKGEECDVGTNQNDPCCTRDCKLKPGATCSNYNYKCCSEKCLIRNAGVKCAKVGTGNPCLGDAVCDGTSAICPHPPPQDGTCAEHGICSNGRCQPYCTSLNLQTCICDALSESCFVCCQEFNIAKNRTICTPAQKGGNTLFINDGRPCSRGKCKNGKCEKMKVKLIQRFWDAITKLTPNQFLEFVKANIVGTVIITSLLIWIPTCIIISIQDRKMRKQAKPLPEKRPDAPLLALPSGSAAKRSKQTTMI